MSQITLPREELEQIVAPAYAALDAIDKNPNDMRIRREAEIAAFYAIQRLCALAYAAGAREKEEELRQQCETSAKCVRDARRPA